MNEDNLNNKNRHDVFKLFHAIMQINFSMQDYAMLFLHLESIRERFVFHGLSYLLKYKQGIFPLLYCTKY